MTASVPLRVAFSTSVATLSAAKHYPAVPRYFFHLIDDVDTTDEEGAELPDLPAARKWAVDAARHLMCETIKADGRITLRHRIDIEDEQHQPTASVAFGDAVEIVS